MSRKTYLVHRNCGGRVVMAEGEPGERCPYCEKCRKWLVGDALERKRKVKS